MFNRSRLIYVYIALVVGLSLVLGVSALKPEPAAPVNAAEIYGTYSLHTSAITETASGDSEAWTAAVEDVEVFAMMEVGSGITEVVVYPQVSYDGTNYVNAKDTDGADISLSFTADGTDYVEVDGLPGLYLRARFVVTGTGTVTPTIKAIAHD
jgi:hypothetical protein